MIAMHWSVGIISKAGSVVSSDQAAFGGGRATCSIILVFLCRD